MKKKLVCLTLALVITVTQVIAVGATREDEIRTEREQTSSQLDATYDRINALEGQKEELAAEINELDQALVDTMVQINVLKKDIQNKGEQITQTKADKKKAEADKDKQYADMKTRIQYLYEEGGNNAWFQMLLEAKDISDFLNKAEYTQNMYDYDRDRLNEYVNTVNEVKELEQRLEGEKAELEEIKVDYEAKQQELEVKISDKKATADDYEAQIANAQDQAQQYTQLIEQQTAEISRLEEERRQAEEAERARIAEEQRQAEAARAAEEQRAAQAAASTQQQNTDTESSDENSDNSSEDTENTSGEVDYTDNDDNSVTTDEYGNVIDSNESSDPVTNNSSTGSYSGRGQEVVNYALQFVGNPYVWGGTSLTGGADCSGFVQSVYAHFGVSLSRTSESQMYDGVGVSYADAQPGDLICYGSHIAIYMGNGQIVHASNSAPYPVGGIKVSDNAAYRTILAVRRVI